jgi:hypothetical protein
MERRAFLALVPGSLLAAPLAAEAQQAARVYRLGFLGQTSAADFGRQTAALRQGLRDLGYEEGRNLIIEYRWAERKLDRLPALATELVALNVDAIVVTRWQAGWLPASPDRAAMSLVSYSKSSRRR